MTQTSATPKLRRGQRLGKYRLEAHLARGGAASVWRARDLIENRVVALKIPPPVKPGSDAEEELLEEIRLSARFVHPNILRVRNADRAGDYIVIATDLAVESLEDRLKRRVGTHRALSYTRQILTGLSHAHEHRVIHRDLKPSNMMLFPGDRLRLADFGLAKVARRTMISATGSGTLLYIAPEQAHGYPCFASDVFSTGLVCYQLLTGCLPRWPFEWPFRGLDVLESKVPRDFVRLLRTATRPNYRKRFRDATEMLLAFDRIQPAVKRFVSPSTRRRRRRPRRGAWREVRCREFQRAFGKALFLRFACPDCAGPISEHMSSCPWCAAEGLHCGEESDFAAYCERCHKGLREEWKYCPWCWGPGFDGADGVVRPDPRYRGACSRCHKPLIEGMSYCPWCHAKVGRPVPVKELADRCPRCRGSVAADYWTYCPWCATPLGTTGRGRNGRR